MEARTRTTAGSGGMNRDRRRGGGEGGYRNRNQGAQEHEQTRRRRWRRRRPRYGGSVAFAGSRQGNEMPPSRGGRPSSSTPQGVSTAVTLPPEPTFLARISRVLLFPGNVAGGGGDGGGNRRRASRRDSVELCVKYEKTRKGPRETFARAYSKRHGNKKRNVRAHAMKKLCGFSAKFIYLMIET